MPISAQESARDRRLLLESLHAFSQGAGDAPLVTKWIRTAEDGVSLSGKALGGEPEDRAVTFVLSTEEVDRHGDVISADGWVLDSYRENPVLLWAHDYRKPAIGRAAKVWVEPHRLLAKMEFAPTKFAQEVSSLYRSGFQWGVSVGFKPLRYEERRDDKTGAFLGLRFLEQELLEVSAVPVPANRSALRRWAQFEQPELAALWPVLASQINELATLAGEIADTVAELEHTAKGEIQPPSQRDPVAQLIDVLRSSRN